MNRTIMTSFGAALLLAAVPAGAQTAAQMNAVTGAENTASTASPGLAGNVVDPTTGAVMPGNQVSSLPPEAAALPPTAESPGLTDAVVTPETGKRSLPWGLLGLLGLAGLLGRKRRRDQDAAR